MTSSSEDSPMRPFFPGGVPLSNFASSAAGTVDHSVTEDDPTFTAAETHSMEETARAIAALDLDETGRVAPYVDFSEFDTAVAAMSEEEREALFAELEPRPDFEPIPEDSELTCAS